MSGQIETPQTEQVSESTPDLEQSAPPVQSTPTPESSLQVQETSQQQMPLNNMPTEAEIQAAMRMMQQPAQPVIDYKQFGQHLAENLKPLMPKAPEPPKPWESEDYLNDPRAFREAMQKWQEWNIAQFREKELVPILQQMQQMQAMMPLMYARAQENPMFNQVQQRANELSQRYGIQYGVAIQMASDDMQRMAMKPQSNVKPRVPGYASSPDTRNTGLPTDILDKGPLDMKDIVSKLRASGQY